MVHGCRPRAARRSRCGPFAAGLAVLAVLLPALPAGAQTSRQDGARRQPIFIRWSNGQFTGHDRASFVAPAIGRGEVVCGRYTQWVRFFPSDTRQRANMWVVRRRGDSTAVRANRLDFPRTGREFNEGMNERHNDLEDEGSFVGIISLRPGAGSLGGPGPTPTTFRIWWKWKFGDSPGDRCQVNGMVVSPPVRGSSEALGSLTINWQHNSSDGRDGDATSIPGVGTLRATCNREVQELTLVPDHDDTSYELTTYQGEGTANATREQLSTVAGEPLRVPLPANGMLTATWDADGSGPQSPAELVLSSEHELNHDENPDLNRCFVAGQVLAKR